MGKEFIVNPTPEQIEKSSLNLMVGASYENICMVEGESKEVSEEDIIEALKVAHDAIKGLCELQNELAKKVGNIEKREYSQRTLMRIYLKILKRKPMTNYITVEEGISNKKKRGKSLKRLERNIYLLSRKMKNLMNFIW